MTKMLLLIMVFSCRRTMSSFDWPSIAQGLDDNSSSLNDDSGITIQRMVLCDKSLNLGGIKIPALIGAILGGIVLWAFFDYLFSVLFAASTIIDLINGLIRIAGVLIISYLIQRFLRTRNMYPGMWPCGFKSEEQKDLATQAVEKTICYLGGLKQAACQVGGLYQLAQAVGGMPVLIKAYGGLACIINDYGTFEDFVCAVGGPDKLHELLPGKGDIYAAMGANNPNDIPMPMDDSQ